MTRTRRSIILAVTAVVGATVLGFRAASSWKFGVDPVVVAADLAVGWSYLGAGLAIALARPMSGSGRLMMAIGVAWFAGTIWPDLEFLHRGPLFHLLATYPTGRLSRRTGNVGDHVRLVVVAAMYILNATRLGAVPAASITYAAALVWVGIGIFRARGAMRRARLSAGAAGIALAVIVLAGPFARLFGVGVGAAGLLAYDMVLVAIAIALATDFISNQRADDLLAGVVVDLGDVGRSGSVRDRLARSLGDPSLELAYVSEGRIDAFVDDLGRPIQLPRPSAGRAVTPMTVAGRHVGYISHDSAVLDEPGIVGLVSAAAGLAMSKSSMQAAVRARVAEVDASRQRLVEASDRQRVRLERRLQTGVTRRLERVAELLAQADVDDTDSVPSVHALQADLDRARLELADLARGIHPATLTDNGLTAALAELVRWTPIPIQLTIDIERADPVTESTIYFVCSEAVANAAKHALPSRISIDLRETGESIRLLISDDGRGGAKSGSHGGLRGLVDRVDALGGQWHLLSEAGRGTTLRVELRRRTHGTSRSSADSAAAAVGPP